MREHFDRFKLFLQEVAQEVRKVTWPTPREIVGATSVVIMATIAMAILLAIYDWFISQGLKVVMQ